MRSDDEKVAEAENEAKFNKKKDENAGNMYQKFYRVDTNNIDYMESPHALALQNSKYVKIENNRERIL